MAIALTLTQIINLSGGRSRRMKQLANEGVFISNEARAGRGARTYTLSEAAIACIVARLDTLNVQSSTLAGVANHLRTIYRVPIDYGFRSHDEGHKFWARNILLTINRDQHLTPEKKAELASSMGLDEYPRGEPQQLSTDESHRIRHWVVLEKAREGEVAQSSLYVKEDGAWTFWLDSHPSKNDEVDIYVVLNLHRILSILR